jgi:hypothetical protein
MDDFCPIQMKGRGDDGNMAKKKFMRAAKRAHP